MKTIIAGCRNKNLSEFEMEKIVNDSMFPITELVCGMALGVDSSALNWANGDREIPVKEFPAEWDKFGPAAGPVRNRHMAAYADALIAIWDGKSRGTANMINEAKKKELPVYIHKL